MFYPVGFGYRLSRNIYLYFGTHDAEKNFFFPIEPVHEGRLAKRTYFAPCSRVNMVLYSETALDFSIWRRDPAYDLSLKLKNQFLMWVRWT